MKSKYSVHSQSILRNFFLILIIVLLLFSVMLIPLLLYLQNVFTELQIEKSRQQLNAGVTKMQEIVVGIADISDALFNDSRFVSLSYAGTDYSDVNVVVRNQLNHTFTSLVNPFDEITHAALQLKQNVVVTNGSVFFEDINTYYPDFFCVNGLSYEAWTALLKENSNRFLPVSRIETYSKEYDALIYSTKWMDSAYLYACIDVDDIKPMMVSKSEKGHCYITLRTLDGALLYSDLPGERSDYSDPEGYTTITEKSYIGSIQISIHMDNSILYQKMKPLYLFIGIYICIYVVMFILALGGGIKFSSRPLLDTDRLMERYQSTIVTQNRILQARFLEKALNGQLITARDLELFHMYFPDFPKDGYCLLLLRLLSDQDDSQSTYTEPLLLIQSYLEGELKGSYSQKISDSELLLLVSQRDYQECAKKIDYLINNVNKEEPLYMVNCVASKFYDHPESLSEAYRQIQNVENLSLSCSYSRICTVDDFKTAVMQPVSLGKMVPLYSAVTNGNLEIALNQLCLYSDEVEQAQNGSTKKQVYEMIRNILLCIKLEYPVLLMDEHVPTYRSCLQQAKNSGIHQSDTIYAWLEKIIQRFCELIGDSILDEKNSLVKQLVEYIDANYTDCELCLMSLETQFKCASSTMRSLFKEEMNITITGYIEQKRMKLANELLMQNQKPVKEIALECGYLNPNSFYKAYKRIYGCSPTNMIKSND